MKISSAFKVVKGIWEDNGIAYTGRDGRAIFGYKELEERRFHLSFSFNERFNGLGILFNCSFIPNEIGEAIDFVTKEKHVVFPFKERKWQFYQVSDTELVTIAELVTKEAETWVRLADISKHIQWLTSTLDVPGAHQLWHISALAMLGNTVQLKTYLLNINSEDRGGLFPYITKDILFEAIRYADECT